MRRIVALSLLCSWLWGSPSAAQESHETRAAQALFEHGLELSQDGRWQQALEAYEASLRLAPREATYFNLALVALELGRGRKALESLATFEQISALAPDSRYWAQARDARKRALKLVGTLELHVEPEDAQVSVDGEAQARAFDERDKRTLWLHPGSYTLQVSAPHHQAWSETLRMVAGQRLEREIRLQPSRPTTPEREDSSLTAAHRATASPPGTDDSARMGRRKRRAILVACALLVAGAVATAVVVPLRQRGEGPSDGAQGGSLGTVF